MIICPRCGAHNDDSVAYCFHCGNLMIKSVAMDGNDHATIGSPCRFCNGILELRFNGKTGVPFYGCSNYPSCMYTESIYDMLPKHEKEKAEFMRWLVTPKPNGGGIKLTTCNSYTTAINTFSCTFDRDVYACTVEELRLLLDECDANEKMLRFIARGHGAFRAAVKKYIEFKQFAKPSDARSLFARIVMEIIREKIVRNEDVVSTRFARGYTPLMLAAKCNDVDTLAKIIAKTKEMHGDFEARNDEGKTAYIIAQESNATNAMELLQYAMKEASALKGKVRLIKKSSTEQST